ncbi:MAG: SurA N-terminal domain-containing protein [Patescibacteria group bacterium]
MKYKKILFWLIPLILIAGGLYFILSDSYPVALVNEQIIEARDFEKDYASALRYYQSVFKVYKEDAAKLDSQESKQEIRRATLDKLIENKLIRENLEKLIKNDELKNMVAQKIKEAVKESPDIQKGVQTLYGLSLDDFKQRILAPQAEREILEGRLYLDGKKIDEWLKQEKSKAKVIILISGFGWDGEGVIIK